MSILWSCIRAFPIIYFFINSINYIINSNDSLMYETILIYLSDSTNFIFKYLFKNLYNTLNINSLPIIGIGKRPNNAIDCNWFLGKDNIVAKSFGMPSGHSQFAWTFSTFYILKIYFERKNLINKIRESRYKQTNFTEKEKYLFYGIFNFITIAKILFLFILAILSSYARVYVEKCHTIEQVFLGGLIGATIGVLLFKFLIKVKKE